MVRSASALWALILLLPSLAQAQQAQTPQVHTVVRGNTLWGLAQRYYSDPWRWPRIYEANRNRIKDPDVIQPGWVLTIPSATETKGDER